MIFNTLNIVDNYPDNWNINNIGKHDNFESIFIISKDQIISKGLFGVLEFSFVHYLGELKDTKSPFECKCRIETDF